MVIQLRYLLKQLRLEIISVNALHRAEGIEALLTAVEADMPNDDTCPIAAIEDGSIAVWHMRMRTFLGLAPVRHRGSPWRPTAGELADHERAMFKDLEGEVDAEHAAAEAQKEDDTAMAEALNAAESNAGGQAPRLSVNAAAGVGMGDYGEGDQATERAAEGVLSARDSHEVAQTEGVTVQHVQLAEGEVSLVVRVRLPKVARTETRHVATPLESVTPRLQGCQMFLKRAFCASMPYANMQAEKSVGF